MYLNLMHFMSKTFTMSDISWTDNGK